MVFVLSMLNQILVSIDFDIYIIEVVISLSFALFHLIIIHLSSEFINHKLKISMNIWKIYAILTFVGLVTVKYLVFYDIISEDYSTLKFIVGSPLRTMAGISMIYGLSRSNLIIKSPRTTFIKNWWIITGLILTLTGIIEFGVYGLDIYYNAVNGENSPLSISIAENIGYARETSLTLIVSIIAIFFPEAMLLSHTQVLKSAKLYDLISETQETEKELVSKSIFRLESSDVLIEYIKSLPDDIIDSLDRRKSN